MTEENGFVQLNRNGSRFILNKNSALGLNYIKKISINDLLLALAMEEIRNVPKDGSGAIQKIPQFTERKNPMQSPMFL